MARMHLMPRDAFHGLNDSSKTDSKPLLFRKLQEFFNAIPAEGYAKDPARQAIYDEYFTKHGGYTESEFCHSPTMVNALQATP
jgi:hypothetical protein